MTTTKSILRWTLPGIFLLTTTLATATSSPATPLTTPPPPKIDARSHLLIDYDTGKILAGEKINDRMEPASLTKIMTVYIVLHELKVGKIHLTDEVRISEKAWRTEGSRTFVEVGKTVPLEVLLKGLIVQSGNDATIALAEHTAGSEDVFAALMNQTAAKLGMKSTHFANSTGLPDPNHYTTAYDISLLTQALIRDYPEHYSWYSIKEFTYNGITQHNRNKLLWIDPNVDGIKTGHTESAGFCLVSSAKQGEMRLIAIVMGTKSENARAAESQKLLNYGFRFFETHRLYAPGKPLTSVRVWKGEQEQLGLGLTQDLYVTIPRGQYGNLKAAMKITPKIVAPINKGNRYGTVEVTIGEEKVAEQALVSLQAIPEGGLVTRVIDEVKLLLE